MKVKGLKKLIFTANDRKYWTYGKKRPGTYGTIWDLYDFKKKNSIGWCYDHEVEVVPEFEEEKRVIVNEKQE